MFRIHLVASLLAAVALLLLGCSQESELLGARTSGPLPQSNQTFLDGLEKQTIVFNVPETVLIDESTEWLWAVSALQGGEQELQLNL